MTDFQNTLNLSVKSSLNSLKHSFELNQIEIDKLKAPLSIDFYEKWLAQNFQGSMSYLESHLPYKKNPRLLGAGLNSVISVAQSYFPAPMPAAQSPARVALYAHNHDYHIWLKQKLAAMITELETRFPGEIFLPYVDSGPVLERDMAYQNGLGWFGKNTCLIHPQHGSLFFIAEILTSLPAPQDNPVAPLPDFCGKCTKCLDACPTGALLAPKTLKADLCISYLTIESKTAPPEELRKKMGDWFFGCDICQTVCPWNEKVFRAKELTGTETDTAPLLNLGTAERAALVAYFRFLLTASHRQIQKHHFGSPLLRAGAKGLKRNALIVIANKNLTELRAEVRKTETEGLRELAAWTLAALVD